MCGRYYVDDGMDQMIARTLGQIEREIKQKGRRDIHPCESADIIEKKNHWIMRTMEWGIPIDKKWKDDLLSKKSRLLINVRSETVLQKPMFFDDFKRNRCIIPAMGFYEWNENKEKAKFHRNDGQVIYMAGFYKTIGSIQYFVILTTKANESVLSVHGRMPLILENGEINDWMGEERYAANLLKKIPVSLEKSQSYEQQRLPFL